MTPTRWQEIDRIFAAALELEPSRRAAFLDQACASDKELLTEVESLLASESAESLAGGDAVLEATRLLGRKPEQLPLERIGRYRIVRSLGAGGMGHVYLAQDEQLKRPVALKLLAGYSAGHAERMRRFRQEALAVSALNHPNILTIYEIGEHDSHNFIATEFVDGLTLSARIKQGELTLAESLDIAIQTANALAAAHAAGIIHRDIKPDNVMVRKDGLVKVLDFGIAKYEQTDPDGSATDASGHTAPGTVLGTVAYMSPEQTRGLPLDARSDLWSLGVVLYEMICGRRPFVGNTPVDVMSAVIERQPVSLNTHNPAAPEPLAQIVDKTLQKERDDRYQTATDLISDLKSLSEAWSRADHSEPAPSLLAQQAATVILPRQPQSDRATSEPPSLPAPTVYSAAYGLSRTGLHQLATPRKLMVGAAVVLLAFVAAAYFYYHRSVAHPTEIKSLAVLPLKSLDAGENYLGLGIADEIIRRINQTGQIVVRPTSAVRRYLNEETDALTAARQLGVDAVLEGSVQRSAERLRVSVNLLRVADGQSLWTDKFDLPTADIFTIQDNVSQQVASRLRLQLDPSQQARLVKRYTQNPVAYELYTKGMYRWDQRRSLSKPEDDAMIDLFQQAVAADPKFALAHAQLAYADAAIAVFRDPTEPKWAERAKEEINIAEKLDPQIAEIHLARHQLLASVYGGFDHEAAIREVLLAQQLNPNSGHVELAYLYSHIGLEDLALSEIQRALDTDPTSEAAKGMALTVYEIGGKYDEWFAAHQKLLPNAPGIVWYLLGKGRWDEAEKMLDTGRSLDNRTGDLNFRKRALLSALQGDFRSAEAQISDILNKHPVKDPF